MGSTKGWSFLLSGALALASVLVPTFAACDGPISKDLRDESSLRCENGIVERGDAKYAVQDKCGKPTGMDQGGDLWITTSGRRSSSTT